MTKKIYLIECNADGYITYKIGRTSRNIRNRLDELNTGNSGKLHIIHEYESNNASTLEKSLHRNYSYCHIKGEWFSDKINTLEFIRICKILDSAISIIKKE